MEEHRLHVTAKKLKDNKTTPHLSKETQQFINEHAKYFLPEIVVFW